MVKVYMKRGEQRVTLELGEDSRGQFLTYAGSDTEEIRTADRMEFVLKLNDFIAARAREGWVNVED